MTEIETIIEQPIVKEGVIVGNGPKGKPEAVILGFIPADERKLNYNLVFGLALSIMKIAEAHGGRAYSTGLYFGGKADDVMGADVVKRIRAYKAKVDPERHPQPEEGARQRRHRHAARVRRAGSRARSAPSATA